MLAPYIDRFVVWFAHLFPPSSALGHSWMVTGTLALILVGFICGAVGPLVVGNRMAFFSDALAHCAVAGVALGLLFAFLNGLPEEVFFNWVYGVMVLFGVLAGVLIAFVREKTALASDTVIGVFFAGVLGFGAMIIKAVESRRVFSLEDFLFGSPNTANAVQLESLFWLSIVTAVFLWFMFNPLLFAGFSTSLARSRRIPTRLANYLFVILLGLIVNLSVLVVGALLINGMLVVPAATAANISRNVRQMMRWSVVICVFVGIAGQFLAWELRLPDPLAPTRTVFFGVSGTTLMLAVVLFAISMFVGRRRSSRKTSVTWPAQA